MGACSSGLLNQWVSSGGAGTMGFGLPAAMGAQAAKPNNEVWCITGDGSFQMNIQELKDNDDSAPSILKDYIFYLQNDLPKYVNDNDTDLLNIRDEIVSNLNKTLYLLTLQ